MNWELYEVWTVDEDGHEDLVDTTKDLKEARKLAHDSMVELDEVVECIIYKEDGEGEMTKVETVRRK